jgi:hypothetical protein
VLWVDIDSDGDLDLINSTSLGTFIYFNSGSGTFSLSATELPAGGMGGVAAADFNRDGLPDILLANEAEGLLLMRQLADGSFEKRPFARKLPLNLYGVAATGVAAGDVNGDGLTDFVFWQHNDAGYGSDELVLGLNKGGLEFEFRDLPCGTLNRVSLAFGDFDNDGCDDLAWMGGNSCGVLQGASNGWMNPVPIEPGVSHIFGGNVAWGDINHDGSRDLMITGHDPA